MALQADFWNAETDLEKERTEPYRLFQKLYNEKVERIQRNYSKELTEFQFALNKKDEELLIATEEFMNILLLQLDRLCRINQGLNTNLMESIADVQKLTEPSAYKNRLESLIGKHKEIEIRL